MTSHYSKDNLEAQDTHEIKSKAKSGLYLLLFRSASLYLIRAASIYFLAKWLSPEDYGMFAIISNWTWAISYFFPDLCVEAALIQVQGKLTDQQMKNFFGLSFWRGIIIFLFFVIFSQFITQYQNIPSSTSMMFILAAVAGMLNSFRLPPKTMMERDLKFKQVVNIEIVETIVMYITQLTLAYYHFGAWSFVLAIFSRSIVGLVMSYYYVPDFFPPILIASEIKGLMKFGLPTQIRKIIIGLKCLLVPVLLGKWLNTYELGILTWTISLASIPAVLSDNYDRVLFPSLSRLQHHAEEFAKTARRGLELSYVLFGIVFGGLAFVSLPLIHLFFFPKWEGAIDVLPLTCFWIFLSRSRHLTGSILNGAGRPKKLTEIEVISLILEVAMTLSTLPFFGLKAYIFSMIGLEILLNSYSLWSCRLHLKVSTFLRPVVVSISMIVAGMITQQSFFYFSLKHQLNLTYGPFLFVTIFVVTGSLIDQNFFKDVKQICGEVFRNFQGKFRNILSRRSRA